MDRLNCALSQEFCHGFYMTIYILQMSDGRFLNKDLGWTTACANSDLFKSEHQDIALNKLVELNAKNIGLRATVVLCELDSKGELILPNHQPTAA